ncbi:unnamed protein product [Fraxinus pennsylvanica]|uniref:RNA helicase n=1 Tax=Fraxinus pennsylvanica TaxID=56036 RepID=A0AAD2A419_9LAMI|nr:unnamed protein product [Fraxinus pennsylvanica]
MAELTLDGLKDHSIYHCLSFQSCPSLNNGGFCCNGGIIGITQPRRVAAVTVAKREALLDPYLSKYSVINVDEALERTVHTDALLNKRRVASVGEQWRGEKSSPLKIIIMSASLDARVFSEYFGGAGAVHGQQYPVDILYTSQPETDYVDATLITIFQVILVTNIAETSVTIPGIKYIIEPGMVKVRTYEASTGIEPLIIFKTSKAQALQGR